MMRRRETKARADGGRERNINSQRWKEKREKGQCQARQDKATGKPHPQGEEGIYRREGRTLGAVDRKSGWGTKRREGDPQKKVAILFLSVLLARGFTRQEKEVDSGGFLTYTLCAVG